MNNDLTIDQLAQAWLDAKEDEEAAIKRRRDIGALLEAALPGADEGTVSNKTADLKISVTRKLTRTVDADALSATWGELSENVQRAFKWKAEIVTKHLRALQELGAAELTEVQQFITTKPAASSVSVERITKE